MVVYVFIEAIVGVILAIKIARSAKDAGNGLSDKWEVAGFISNILFSILYLCLSPFFMFLGMICEPMGEGLLFVASVIVCVIAASASFFCSLGMGISAALRRNGRNVLSFVTQYLGMIGIALTVLLYVFCADVLISPLN